MRQPIKPIQDSTELFLRNIHLAMKKKAIDPLEDIFPEPSNAPRPELPKLPELPPPQTPEYQNQWKKWHEELMGLTEQTRQVATPMEEWQVGDRFVLLQDTYATDLISLLGPGATEKSMEDIVGMLMTKYRVPQQIIEGIIPPAIDDRTFLSIFNMFSLAKLAQLLKMMPAGTFASVANTEGPQGIQKLLETLKPAQQMGEEPPVAFSSIVSWAEQALFGRDVVPLRRSWHEDKKKGVFTIAWVFKQQPLNQPEWQMKPELAIDWQLALRDSRKMRIKMEWKVTDLVPEFVVQWTEFSREEEGNILPAWYKKFDEASEFITEKLAKVFGGGGKAPMAIKLDKQVVADANQMTLKKGKMLEYLGRVSDLDTIFPRKENPLSMRLPEDIQIIAHDLMIFGLPGRVDYGFMGTYYVFSVAAPPMLKKAQVTTNQAPGHGGQTEGLPSMSETNMEPEKLEVDDRPRLERKKKDLGVNSYKEPKWKTHGKS